MDLLEGLVAVSVTGLVNLLALALIILLVYLIVEATSMLRFDTREYIVEGGVEEVRKRLSEELSFRGLAALGSDQQLVIDDVFTVTLKFKGEDGRTRIFYYAEAKTWLILVVVILLAINVAVGALAAFLAYLKYDDLKKTINAAIASLGAKPQA